MKCEKTFYGDICMFQEFFTNNIVICQLSLFLFAADGRLSSILIWFVAVLLNVMNTTKFMLVMNIHAFFIRNLAQGLVLKVPYFRTSFYQILVLKVP